MRITAISDTHARHGMITKDIPGGDVLICAGDIATSGKLKNEYINFFNWFEEQSLKYSHSIFIAGNHDWLFETNADDMKGLLTGYKYISYLQDESIILDSEVHVYGSPWQPEFFNWAFNLPRNGDDLSEKWSLIPPEADILVTHTPPFGYLDVSGYGNKSVGCELLRQRIDIIKPKIHIFGHIHSGYGYRFNGETHFINASVLNEQYMYRNKPLTFDWDADTNEIEFLTDI